ncbi:hypothetical protein Slin15195_G073960 [Septoria linicola]|uniref:DUF6604 domain-containing protein n=1 Tax=Septoria linicola TaxID=215465 RepID=A0A9Q9EL75_9PEZI|nr:hypothetical protein Slin14017_G035090 [Septoria linicola]USW54077.1 hypothetical protein Slin15195_G073960 [Septoria linicola]
MDAQQEQRPQGRYARYKAGTRRVIKWLTKIARRCCDIRAIIKSLKKLFKEAASAHTNSIPQHLSTYPPQSVPQDILDTLDEVITARRESADWYAAHPVKQGQGFEEDNARHLHFIKVLEQVQKILDSSISSSSNGQDRLDDMIQDLTLEPANTAVEPISEIDIEGSEVVLEEGEGDDVFALWCFLEDLNDVRNAVSISWNEVVTGDLSVTAAAVITEKAFKLMSAANDTFVAQYPKFYCWAAMQEYMWLAMTLGGPSIYCFPAGEHKDFKFQPPRSGLSPARLLCINGASLLIAFGKACDQFDPASGSATTKWDLFCPETSFGDKLRGLMDDVYIACRVPKAMRPLGNDSLEPDVFTKALITLCRPSIENKFQTPIWFAVAAQIPIIIHDVLSAAPDRAYQDLRRIAISAEKLAMSLAKKARTAQKTRLESVRDVCRELLDPKPAKLKGKMLHYKQFNSVQRLKVLPTAAACISQTIKSTVHEAGIEQANDGCIVLGLAYLYRCLRHQNAVHSWPDMEYVITQHSLVTAREDKQGKSGHRPQFADAYALALTGVDKTGERTASPSLPSKKAIKANARALIASTAVRPTTPPAVAWGKQAVQAENLVDQLIQFKNHYVAGEIDLNFNYVTFAEECARLLSALQREIIARVPDVLPRKKAPDHEVLYSILQWLESTEGNSSKSRVASAASSILGQAIDSDAESFLSEARSQSSGSLSAEHHIPRPLAAITPDFKTTLLMNEVGAKTEITRTSFTIWDARGTMRKWAGALETTAAFDRIAQSDLDLDQKMAAALELDQKWETDKRWRDGSEVWSGPWTETEYLNRWAEHSP